MKTKNLYVFVGVFILLVLWAIVAGLNIIDSFFLPGPIEVFSEMATLFIEGTITLDIIATLVRVLEAFAIALIIGVPVGLLLGSNEKIYDSMGFIIDFFRSLPATAIFPLFLLVLGVGDESKIAVAAFGALLIIIFNTAYGLKHSNKHRHRAAKLMGATKLQIFGAISIWETLPQTFAGIRTAVSITLIVIIVTEMFIGTPIGLGRRIIDFQYIYNINGMYAVIILTGLLGYILNMLFAWTEKKVIHWSGK